MTEGRALVVPEAVAIRAAVSERRSHRADRGDVLRSEGTLEGHEAGYATHGTMEDLESTATVEVLEDVEALEGSAVEVVGTSSWLPCSEKKSSPAAISRVTRM